MEERHTATEGVGRWGGAGRVSRLVDVFWTTPGTKVGRFRSSPSNVHSNYIAVKGKTFHPEKEFIH